jgi:hypothetical protein
MARPVHIPLSGRDRRFFVRQLKNAPQFESANLRRAALLRADGEVKLREARRLECEAWNARLFYGGSIQPSPTIADAMDAGFGRVEAGCHRCNRINTVELALLRRRAETEVWKLEASLICEHCRGESGQRAQAYIIGLAETKSDEPIPPSPQARAGRPNK